MSAPPVPPLPPRPYELSSSNSNSNSSTQNQQRERDPNSNSNNLPPPVPPLPPSVRLQNERYNTPSPYEYPYDYGNSYESPPRFENPLIAPRPHRLDASIPVNMAKTLDEQVYGRQPPQQQQQQQPGGPPPPPHHASSLPPPPQLQSQSQSQSHPNQPQSNPYQPHSQTSINYTPGFVIPQNNNSNNFNNSGYQTYQAPPVDLATSIANLSMASYAPPLPASAPAQSQSQAQQFAQQFQSSPPLGPAQVGQARPTTPSHSHSLSQSSSNSTSTSGSLPSLTAPLPNLAQLIEAAPQIQSPAHDPALKVAWCRDVFFLVDRAHASGSGGAGGNPAPSSDPAVGPVHVPDPELARLGEVAVGVVLAVSRSWNPPQGQGQGGGRDGPKMPPYIAEATYLRAMLAATGGWPEHVRHNPRTAFRDFEAAARGGYAGAWFRLGRDYENFNDHAHAKECFERGVRLGVESCLYRMGMAHLLGQLSLPQSPTLALPLLHRAALSASLTTPQPAYVYALLLLAEFSQITLAPTLFSPFIPPGSSPALEARKHLERAAYLHFAPAQYKLGHAYEFADPPWPFDPLLSVQWYSLASQQGEVEADMALSKWFLCGSGGAALSQQGQSTSTATGGFEKDEGLALTFAEKAARRGLPSAEFAMGYYAEVGVGQPKDVKKAIVWYERAKSHANPDAAARLAALAQPSPQTLSRQEHDTLTEAKLVRRRTQAMQRAEREPLSPPWEGRVFPSAGEWERGVGGGQGQGRGGGQAQGGGIQQGQGQGQRRRQDGRMVVDVIRKNSLAAGYNPPPAGPVPASAPAGPGRPLRERERSQSPRRQGTQGTQGQRSDWIDNATPPRTASPGNSRRNESPNRSGRVTPQGGRGRDPSPGPGGGRGRLPIGPSTGSSPQGTPPVPNPNANASPAGTPAGTAGGPGGRSKLERMRLNLDDPGVVPYGASTPSGAATPGHGLVLGAGTPSTARPLPSTTGLGLGAESQTPGLATGALDTPRPGPGGVGGNTTGTGNTNTNHKRPQTFAEMGIHGAKVDDKECVVM